jgi:selenocysteine lyase/cysteine desulfurase
MTGEEFTLDSGLCYLNHAAIAPWPQRTVRAVERFARENGACGSRHYPRWLQIEQELREQLRQLINARSSEEIALLKNTSEALSVVAWGIDWQAGDRVVITNQEFPSNRIVWESLRPLGVEVIEADISRHDSAETAVIGCINPRTRLVSVSSVQYSSGLALDLDTIGAACRSREAMFCVDAIQSIGAGPFDVQACQADFVMADGHKWMLGPEGLALFYCRQECLQRLTLHQYGWHMVQAMGDYDRRDWQAATGARRFECGSPNMLAIHALHASVGLLLETGLGHVYESISGNISYLIDNLSTIGANILSETRPDRRGGIVTFQLPGVDTAALHRYLQEQGVVCALRGGGVRFSPHFYTPQADLERALSLTQGFK